MRYPFEMINGSKDFVLEDVWEGVKGEYGGVAYSMRYRPNLTTHPDLASYPKLIRVIWGFASNETNLPTAQDRFQMARFESRLVEAVETDLAALLVAVVTNHHQRIWSLYAHDSQEFSQRLNQIPQETEPYPISVVAKDDAEWAFYKLLVR